MNDLDIRHAVQAAGDDIAPAFRRELADLLRAELAGETVPPIAPVLPLDASRRQRRRMGLWAGLGVVGVAAATVTALVVLDDPQAGIVVSDTGPDATSGERGPDGPATTEVTATTAASPVDTTIPLPQFDPASAPGATSQDRAVVSPDSLKQPLTAVPVAGLDIAAMPDGRLDLAPYVSFLPDGGLLVLDRQRATASVMDPDGTTRWSVGIPATLHEAPVGQTTVVPNTPWEAALGPDDVLYVSYAIGDAYGPEGFALAAVAIAGDGAGTVVAQWQTDWECVEGTCGEVTLQAEGIQLLWSSGGIAPYVDATGAPSGSTYDVSTLQQATTLADAALPDGYLDSTGYGSYGAGGLDVTLGDDGWHVDALGVRWIEGAFTFASEQPDGSVLAWVTTTTDSALPGVTTLVRMQPGGAIEQYLAPQLAYLDVESVGGVLYAVEPTAVDGGTGYGLVALVPDGDTTTGTLDTVVPTTVPPPPRGLPAAVASLPSPDRLAGAGDDRLAGASGVRLTSVLGGRADGSGDVFATRAADDEHGVLVIVRTDGTVVDLGIAIGLRGGVVSSNEDRLYVWDDASPSSDGQSVTWTVYEPAGTDRWAPVGEPMLQASAGECTFYVSGEGCRSAAQAAPLVDGDTVDWAVASPDLTTLTVSVGGSATSRALTEPDLDTTTCFDSDCSFQFAPGPDGLVYAWHGVANDDGTTRTAIIGMRPDGSSSGVWLPGTGWYLLGVDGTLVGWRLGDDGFVGSITSWPSTAL